MTRRWWSVLGMALALVLGVSSRATPRELPDLRLVELESRMGSTPSLPPYVTLREFERRWEILQREIDKAEAAMAQRLLGMNEFREQLRAQATTFVTVAEVRLVTERLEHLDGRLQKIEVSQANLDGRLAAGGLIITAFVTLLQLGFYYVGRHKDSAL